ncbi:hypothetical protein NX059_010437 [Plenodomus lindquistii]|nr:hypothetical protein NX059_010437 [Plenodomus lindquistii]
MSTVAASTAAATAPGPAARAAVPASTSKEETGASSAAPSSASMGSISGPKPATSAPTAPVNTPADPATPVPAPSAVDTATNPGASPSAPYVADLESNVAVKPRRRAAGCLPGFDSRPPFRTWLRGNCLDLLTILLCALGALLIYLFVPPLLPRHFPLYPGVETSSWGRRYGQPVRPEYINTLTSALVSYLVPAAIIGAIALWRTRDFGDGNAALIGLGYALATTALFCSCIKVLIGGLRPNFL